MDPHVPTIFSFPVSEGRDLLFLCKYSGDFSLILYSFGLGFLHSFPFFLKKFLNCFFKINFLLKYS